MHNDDLDTPPAVTFIDAPAPVYTPEDTIRAAGRSALLAFVLFAIGMFTLPAGILGSWFILLTLGCATYTSFHLAQVWRSRAAVGVTVLSLFILLIS